MIAGDILLAFAEGGALLAFAEGGAACCQPSIRPEHHSVVGQSTTHFLVPLR
jgi:hypothetical protein